MTNEQSKEERERLYALSRANDERRMETVTSMLIDWIYDPDAAFRLDQVLAVANGGSIFIADSHRPNYSRMCDRLVEMKSADAVVGLPKISAQWRSVYNSSLPFTTEKKREMILFILFYGELRETVITLAPLALPVYVLLEILDWLPHIAKASRYFKVKLIENVYRSIKLVQEAREESTLSKDATPTLCFENNNESSPCKFASSLVLAKKNGNSHWKLTRKAERESRIWYALIVLKGNYTGIVHMDPGMQPSGCFKSPNLHGACGMFSFNLREKDNFDEWLAKVKAMPFLQPNFTYMVTISSDYIDFSAFETN